MKNYLEHENKVKYVDGLLAREQEWQWFVECIEECYELSDVNSWSEYLDRNKNVREIYSYFVNILGVCDKGWIVEAGVLNDIIKVARFYLGIVDVDACKVALESNVGKFLFLTIWVTKLENQDNHTSYIADMRLFVQRNVWQILKVESMELIIDKIEAYFDCIRVVDIENPQKCLLDNINKVEYAVREGFIEKYKTAFLSADAINFNSEKNEGIASWQEEYILQMLQPTIDDRELKPLMSFGGVVSPDSSLWTIDVIENMKQYFSDESTDFILETIAYIKHNIEPSDNTKLLHCGLLKKLVMEAEDIRELIRCSSYTVVSYMFEDKMFRTIGRESAYIEMIQEIQKILDPYVIIRLRKDKYPVSSEQKKLVREYYESLCHQINNVNDIHSLVSYIKNVDVAKRMDTECFQKVRKVFYQCIETSDRDILVTNLFYEYMLFLMRLNTVSISVDKRIVGQEIIQVQKTWEEKYYKEQVGGLQKISYETEVPTKEVDEYNSLLLLHPIIAAKSCMMTEEQMCQVMENASEHAMLYMVKRMQLSPVYPTEGGKVIFERHDIDIMLKQTVEKLRQDKGYRFMNVLDTDIYVFAIHERYCDVATTLVAMFREEEKVYQILQENTELELLPYDKEVKLAHLTQLFPLLEIKIRELASLTGIVPFKERLEDFMKYKDSSTVLRELIQEIYKELEGLDNIPDLLFVYHFMYNGNSLNIRNECLHGRDYIRGSRVKFAFRLTLLAIYMLVYRIDTIKENMEEETESSHESCE